MKYKNLFALFAFFLILIILTLVQEKELGVDLFHHLKTGEYIVKNKFILRDNTYSCTSPEYHWINHEWLSEIIFYKIYSLGNAKYLLFLKVILISLIFLHLFVLCLKKSNNLLFSVVFTVLSIFATKDFFLLRPQLFSYLFFIIFLMILENKKYLFVLPFLTIFWVNLHGSFILGIILLLIYIVGERNKKLISFFLLTIIFSLINPYFYKIYFLVYRNITNPLLLENIKEWASPDFHLKSNLLYELFIFITPIILIFSKKEIDTTSLIKITTFLFSSFSAVRNVPFFIFIITPILVENLSFFIKIDILKENKIIIFLYIIFLLFVSLKITNLPSGDLFSVLLKKDFYPVSCIKFMKEKKLPKNLFNDYDFGGYLIFELYPKYKVFIDGRIVTSYPDKVISEYREIIYLKPSWKKILNKYKVKTILIGNRHPLVRLLKEEGSFKLIYSDKVGSIFLKR